MKGSLLLLPVLLIAAIAAGCGGSTAKLSSGDVALVGNDHVPQSAFNELMTEAKANAKQQGATFPKAGTAGYATVRSDAMTLLVQDAEKQVESEKLGIKISTKAINARLAQIKKTYFPGDSEAQFVTALKPYGLTEPQLINQIKGQLRDSQLFDKLTKSVTVAPTAVEAYYITHESSYSTKPTRDVRYILVGKNKSALALQIYNTLKNASDKTWCSYALKYSLDTSSSAKCGKATFTQGTTVPGFDKLLFSLGTKKIGKVNTTEYGWFVLEPLKDTVPASTKPEKSVAASITTKLLQSKKNSVMTAWVSKISKNYCTGKKIQYQVGYQPSPDPCAALTSTSTSTTTP